MYFETLVVDFETPRIEDARVGDEVFNGASVVLEKLPRSEIVWVAATLKRAAAIWEPGSASPSSMDLTGTLDGEAGAYTLLLDGAPTTSWTALSESDRAEILELYAGVLRTVNGLLEIV